MSGHEVRFSTVCASTTAHSVSAVSDISMLQCRVHQDLASFSWG